MSSQLQKPMASRPSPSYLVAYARKLSADSINALPLAVRHRVLKLRRKCRLNRMALRVAVRLMAGWQIRQSQKSPNFVVYGNGHAETIQPQWVASLFDAGVLRSHRKRLLCDQAAAMSLVGHLSWSKRVKTEILGALEQINA